MTDNISVSDRLIKINGSIGTFKHIDRRSNLLCSTIHVTFDDPKAGSSLKDEGFMVSRRNVYQFIARSKKSPLKKGKSTVIAERKQFLLILGQAIAVISLREVL